MNIFSKNFFDQQHPTSQNIISHNKTSHKTSHNNIFQKVSCAILATSLTAAPFLLPFFLPLRAIASPLNSQNTNQKFAQLSEDWQTGVRLLRLLDNNGNLSSIGILLDVANKPTTKYANAVYQLYVKRSGEWREVYTNSGARLLNKNAGRYLLPVEVISLDRLSERISLDDIYNGDVKAITSVRYDLPNGVKDASFFVEETKSFASIPTFRASDAIAGRILSTPTSPTASYPNTNYPATSYPVTTNSTINTSAPNITAPTTTAIYSNNSEPSDRDLGISNTGVSNNSQSSPQSSNSQIINTTQSMQPILVSKNNENSDEDEFYDSNNQSTSNSRSHQHEGAELSNKNPHRGHFSLGVLQSQSRLSAVVARLSIKSKRPKGFIEERFVGDYQFAINQRATFIRGLNAGDRLVVRLFDLQNRPLGYSEVQLLKDFANISLILPSDPSAYGLLRTVSGIDSQRIGQIDRNGKFYDYFTQIQNSSAIAQTTVRFLASSQGIPLNLFNIAGLPQAPSQFSYTKAFVRGDYALSDRVINVFTRNMPPVMQVLPAQLTALIPINNTQSTFDVVRKILDYKDVRPNGIATFF
jgi:hypothetical protein